MPLHQRYNNEDILSRAIIAGLLNILNNQITYEQVWANDDVEEVDVPWFYNMSGDERFMQDFYTFYAHCVPPRPADGNFDIIPRGIITYKGSAIEATRITSRYVQAHYLKKVDGQLQTYRSFLYSIPLTLDFECEIHIDTQVTALKIEQLIREFFYKTITFYVYYKGLRVGCTVGFPESYNIEKNIEYSFEEDNTVKLTFSLEVEAYQPVFDPTTEVNANQYMTGIGYRIIDKPAPKHDGILRFTADTSAYAGVTIPKGYPLLLEWDYFDENAIVNRVDVLWSETGENDRNVIERLVPNHEYYVWNIPENFTDYKHPAIIWPSESDSSVSIYRDPIIRILPDVCTGEITSSSFHIVDGGYFLSPEEDSSVNVILEMMDDDGNVYYSGDSSLYFVLSGHKLDEDEVNISDTVKLPYGSIYFPGTVDYEIVDIYVVNSVTGYDNALIGTDEGESFTVVRNVTII